MNSVGAELAVSVRRSAGKFSRPVGWCSAALIVAALLGSGGCAPEPDAGRPFVLTDEGTPEATWPFWPRAMRIHPLTRFTDHPKNPDLVLLETRIEFTDAWNDPCKALGELQFELFDREDPERFDEEADRYYLDLRILANNSLRWDQVTRTYVLKLEVSRERLARQPLLVAWFKSADGAEVTDRLEVRPYRARGEDAPASATASP